MPISHWEGEFKIRLLPLCYWHEYLDLVYFFKILKSNDPNIVVKSSGRVTRHNSAKNILTNVPRVNNLTFQNSYVNRAPRTYNCLPSYMRDADVTIGQFKSYLLKYYHEMTELIYDINVPQSFKTVCVKCHSCRPLSSLVDKMCCNWCIKIFSLRDPVNGAISPVGITSHLWQS
jgi:hypothetical protein